MTDADIAEAFSRHRFAETYDRLAPDVRWISYGGPTLHGKEVVVAACEESAAHLSTVQTEFRSFRTVAGDATVVTDSVSAYFEADGTRSVVASCDLYDFADGRITAITSYTLALEA